MYQPKLRACARRSVSVLTPTGSNAAAEKATRQPSALLAQAEAASHNQHSLRMTGRRNQGLEAAPEADSTDRERSPEPLGTLPRKLPPRPTQRTGSGCTQTQSEP